MKMKRNLFGILVVVLAVSIVALGNSATDRVQLRLHLQEGKSYNIQMTIDQKISQTIQGQRQDMTQTMGMGYSFDVVEVDENGMVSVKFTYHSVRLKQAGAMGTIEYDSSSPPDVVPPPARAFAALMGEGFSVKFSPEGHVKDVWGVDTMITNMMEKLDIPEGPMKDSMEQNLRNQYSDQALKQMMENMFAIYPDRLVGIGDSWTKRIVISRGFPMILDNTWTLKSRKDGVAIIEAHSTVKPNLEAAPEEIGSMGVISYNLSGKQEGTMEMEEATGMTIRSKLTQQLSGQVMMKPTPQMPEGMSWPISMESTISYETLER